MLKASVSMRGRLLGCLFDVLHDCGALNTLGGSAVLTLSWLGADPASGLRMKDISGERAAVKMLSCAHVVHSSGLGIGVTAA